MRSRVLLTLIGLNLLLVLALVAKFSKSNTATAQVPRPAEYVMIPGEVSGGSSAVVYIVDETNGLLGAMTYDDSNKQLNTMPPIDLSRVFQTGPNVGARQGTGVAPRQLPNQRVPGRGY